MLLILFDFSFPLSVGGSSPSPEKDNSSGRVTTLKVSDQESEIGVNRFTQKVTRKVILSGTGYKQIACSNQNKVLKVVNPLSEINGFLEFKIRIKGKFV